jgi:type II secretory pathway pseudopilin PulG
VHRLHHDPLLTVIRRRRACERGETLIELLVSISIIGIAIIALVGGLATAITASNAHREQADAGAVARNIAEAIKDTTVPLDANGSYGSGIWGDVDVPSSVTVNVPPARCWNGDANASSGSAWVDCPNDNGLQKITVTVSANGANESVTILKRAA